MTRMRAARPERGFLIIAAVFLLVVLAGLVAYMTTVSSTSQAASAADFNSARAYQAARAGAEWASYRILQGAGGAGTLETQCAAGTATARNLTFGTALSGFTATVNCTGAILTEGAATVTVYQIVSTGCNQATCPTVTTSATYAERQVSLTLTK
jgi:MSHA biogenesis protein MshP